MYYIYVWNHCIVIWRHPSHNSKLHKRNTGSHLPINLNIYTTKVNIQIGHQIYLFLCNYRNKIIIYLTAEQGICMNQTELSEVLTQSAQAIKTTLLQRSYNVLQMSCDDWGKKFTNLVEECCNLSESHQRWSVTNWRTLIANEVSDWFTIQLIVAI